MTEDTRTSAAEPISRALTPRRGVVRGLLMAGALVVVAIVVGTAMTVDNFRQRALDNSRRELENTVLLLQHHFDQQFQELQRIQKGLRAQLMGDGIMTPESFAHALAGFEAHLMLKSKLDDEFPGELTVLDATGKLINWSGSWPPPDLSMVERDYFDVIKDQSFRDEEIVQPVLSKITGRWKTVFARRINGPRGEFFGVITRGIEPKHMEKFFASVSLGDGATVSMFHRDGTLLARHPSVPDAIGRKFSGSPLLEHLRFSNEPLSIRTVSPIDNVDRLGALRLLNDFPIAVIATASIEGILADWRSQTKFLIVIAAGSSLLLSGFLFVITRQISRQGVRAQRELTLEKNRLATAINNMNQGLLLFDADARVVVCNQRYLDMYGLSADVIVPGLPFRNVIEYRKQTGSFDGDVDAHVATIMRNVARSHSLSMRTADGRAIQIVSQPVADGGWVATHEDVTERRQVEERIAHLAHFDALTDLPNRTLFRTELDRELKRVGRGSHCAVLYIDIDEFKSINDTLGHPVGDELLKEIARRLRLCVRGSDVVARLGGDEFAIVQTDVGAQADITDLVSRIYAAIREPYECLGHRLLTDASIGIAMAPRDGTDLDELLKNADLAMYGAKAEGRRTFRFFEPQMNAKAKARRLLESDLRQAISGGGFTAGGFEVYYQPFLNLRDDSIAGCEALLRWRHPERGMISPVDFIPVAEDIGVINQIGEWVLSTACLEAAGWPDEVRIAINVSPAQFRGTSLPLKVAAALAASGLPARRLELEITEAVLIRDDETALDVMQQLRELGVRIALDDFGTGYSSLSYLQRFPFDKIKIDRSFITDIAEAHGSSSIVQAVVNIAASRHMTTTAEGVETQQQKELLQALGCTEMQGYLFSKPKPAADVRELLTGRTAQAGAAA
ncbi:MAG: EAL domain-containing protein [Hyphomicrobiales bacterium]|nr:EAL domain-containing protein [Hyphomicrobiales bacterium]